VSRQTRNDCLKTIRWVISSKLLARRTPARRTPARLHWLGTNQAGNVPNRYAMDGRKSSLRHPGAEARTLTFLLLVAGSVAVRSMRTTFVGSATIGMVRREAMTLIPEYILSPRHAMQCRAGKGGDASHTGALAYGVLGGYALALTTDVAPCDRHTQVTRACLFTCTASLHPRSSSWLRGAATIWCGFYSSRGAF
jgi:hypothetical protein